MKYMLLIHQGTTPTPNDPEAVSAAPTKPVRHMHARWSSSTTTPSAVFSNASSRSSAGASARVAGGTAGSAG